MRFLPLVGVMALIFVLSHTPGKSLPEAAIFGQDKFLHALAYGTLAVASLWAWLPQVKKRPAPSLAGILLFCLLFGISDEFHQSFIPGRYSSLADIGADVIGTTIFLCLWWVWYAKKT